MPKSRAPIPMLERCRARFLAIRDWEHSVEKQAPTITVQEFAAARRREAEKYVAEIDATLRDWA
jgi:hypothetical protein